MKKHRSNASAVCKISDQGSSVTGHKLQQMAALWNGNLIFELRYWRQDCLLLGTGLHMQPKGLLHKQCQKAIITIRSSF